jgi:ABC-2 type transport system permease protein
MTADSRALPTPARTGVSLGARLFGLGSVFGKTLRDSRRAILIVGLMGGGFMLVTAAPMAVQFGSREARLELVASMSLLPPVLTGLLGEAIAIDTLGGFMSWRIGNILPALLGIWSVIALSGTLAGEAKRGSLDLLVATPSGRVRVAAQKYLGHVVALVIAMIIATILTSLAGVVFATLPGDEVSVAAAAGHFTLTGLLILAAGSVAWAVGPIIGRGKAAGLGFAALFGGYLINSYASLSPFIDSLRSLSWFAWTVDHRPLAGQSDWVPVVVLAVVTAALAIIGVFAFSRRDLNRPMELAWLRLPALPSGVGSPFVRQLADRTGAAIGWGLGVGVYGAVIASSSEAFVDGILQVEGMAQLINALYPGLDLGQPSAILQLAFFSFGTLLIGFAGATFLAAWASDENDRRLDVVLSTPLSRARWALASGSGVIATVFLVMVVGAIPIGLAVAGQGGDVVTPTVGLMLVALYGAAFAGIGLAVGGLVRATLAPAVTGGLVAASFLLELLGNALDLPEEVIALSLNHHQGQALAGMYDPVGITAGLVLAVGGLLVGAWGWTRRDIGR